MISLYKHPVYAILKGTYKKELLRLIVLERKPSIRLRSYELLNLHLPPSHPISSALLDEISLLHSGNFGEQRVDHAIQHFSSNSFLIFQNAVFPFSGETIQIDHLCLTPFFALIIETKNMKGHLKLNKESGQMYREKDGKVQCFLHPVLQVERQQEGLEYLFTGIGCTLPIYKLVVFTHPEVFLQAEGTHPLLPPEICRFEQLTVRVRSLLREHNKSHLKECDLQELSQTLLNNMIPDRFYDVMKRFGLSQSDLASGVWCNECKQLSMKWLSLRWRCTLCKRTDNNAYKRSIEAYFRFISPALTNKEARQFLGVDSPDTMRRHLHSMNLKTVGNCRSRKYLSPFH
ncbi:NERD domain-containing protein [Jeotgalibacillus sp. S-D1]|uniref:nuclease-related domain-containing protein n=1 Tax=Jeotgalibacillus sp. S-D1 TaxID=2552189 RepID=UPI001059B3B1|nr:nuclease-related domain-containing protein [Jeotgalibacillus sp. S-D1]TDL31246.1 NERD domain-containing protein [Jeotgalibacillus sp. S-D1]